MNSYQKLKQKSEAEIKELKKELIALVEDYNSLYSVSVRLKYELIIGLQNAALYGIRLETNETNEIH